MADISQDLVVTASSDGVVIVRNRETLGSVYGATHHGDQAVVGLRVTCTEGAGAARFVLSS